jgi:hypothetical protein
MVRPAAVRVGTSRGKESEGLIEDGPDGARDGIDRKTDRT